MIAGIALSDYPIAPELDGVQHHVLAMQRVFEDSGVAKAEIDGYMSAGGGGIMVDGAVSMSEYLGIDHRWVDGTMTGGSSFEFHVQHAAAADASWSARRRQSIKITRNAAADKL